MLSRKPKRKKCKECRKLFQPLSSFHSCCSVPCSIAWCKTKDCKDYMLGVQKKEARKARKEYNESKKSHWENKLQVLVNRHVRQRDAGKPCISCGTTKPVQYCAGHYKTRGAHPELRFELRNIFLQCNKNCNLSKSGNIPGYRLGIIERKGQAELDWLDGKHDPLNYTIPDLKDMIDYYKEKIGQG